MRKKNEGERNDFDNEITRTHRNQLKVITADFIAGSLRKIFLFNIQIKNKVAVAYAENVEKNKFRFSTYSLDFL